MFLEIFPGYLASHCFVLEPLQFFAFFAMGPLLSLYVHIYIIFYIIYDILYNYGGSFPCSRATLPFLV